MGTFNHIFGNNVDKSTPLTPFNDLTNFRNSDGSNWPGYGRQVSGIGHVLNDRSSGLPEVQSCGNRHDNWFRQHGVGRQLKDRGYDSGEYLRDTASSAEHYGYSRQSSGAGYAQNFQHRWNGHENQYCVQSLEAGHGTNWQHRGNMHENQYRDYDHHQSEHSRRGYGKQYCGPNKNENAYQNYGRGSSISCGYTNRQAFSQGYTNCVEFKGRCNDSRPCFGTRHNTHNNKGAPERKDQSVVGTSGPNLVANIEHVHDDTFQPEPNVDKSCDDTFQPEPNVDQSCDDTFQPKPEFSNQFESEQGFEPKKRGDCDPQNYGRYYVRQRYGWGREYDRSFGLHPGSEGLVRAVEVYHKKFHAEPGANRMSTSFKSAQDDRFYCKICEKSVNSLKLLDNHCKGKHHTRKLEFFGLDATTPIDEAAEIIKKSLEDPDIMQYRNDAGGFYCSLCGVEMNHIRALQLHLNGMRHARREELVFRRENSRKPMDKSKERLEEASKERLHCKICHVSVNSLKTMDDHLKGTLHALKSNRSHVVVIRETENASDEVKSKSSCVKPEENSTDSNLYCKVCQITVNSLKLMESHLKGKPHIRRLKHFGLDSTVLTCLTCSQCNN